MPNEFAPRSFIIFEAKSTTKTGLHEALYFSPCIIGLGDSVGIGLAGDSEDVLVVDLFYLDWLVFGSLGAYFQFYFSVLSHPVERED